MAYADPNKPILARKVIVTDQLGRKLIIDAAQVSIDSSSQNPDETGPATIYGGGNSGSSTLIIASAPQVGSLVDPQLRFVNYSKNYAGGIYPNGFGTLELNNADQLLLSSRIDSNNDVMWDGSTGTITRRNEVWQGTATIPLAGTWTDVAGARFGVYKDAVGVVHVRGKVANGGAVTIATLPVGYRPSSNLDFTMRTGTVLSGVGVSTAGVLTVTANFASIGATGINLDVISFPTQ